MCKSRVDWRVPLTEPSLLPPPILESRLPWCTLEDACQSWALFTLHVLSGHERVFSGEAPHRLYPLWGGLIQPRY